MKKMIYIILVLILGFMIGKYCSIFTAKIINIEESNEGELITINILGENINYFYEIKK